MTTNRRLLFIVPSVAFAMICLVLLMSLLREGDGRLPSVLVGRSAPILALRQLGNNEIPTSGDLEQQGAKLINFWASWCAPCRVEHPYLQEIAASGIPIIGVNYKDNSGQALDFLASVGDPYSKVGADPQGRNAIEWGVYGIPETFVLDGEGRIVLRFAGPITGRIMTEIIGPALDEAGN